MSLPVSVGFLSKNNNKYLRYISEDKQLHGFLQFSGHELVTPYSKFHVDVAMTGNGSSFVHIRSAYNNKYLVRSSKNHGWINAEADEPNEDQSSWSCTLFEPVAVDKNDPNVIRLRHVQLGRYASLGKSSAPFTSCLFAGSVDDDLDALTVINFEKLFVLPKYITFKGDNGKYLRSEGQYLQFLSDDIKDTTVWCETFINNDGSAQVKSDHFAKFWRRASNNKIELDSDDSTPNPNNLFWPIIVENNVVALRNLANNFYCKRLTDTEMSDYLSTQLATITKEAKVEIEETLASRDINNVVYQITDARIYDVSPVILSSSTAENKDKNPSQVIFKISYTNSSTASWNSSLSRKVFSKVTLDADILFVAIGGIDEISGGRFKGDYDWGETVTNEAQITEDYTTTVPGNTRAIVNLVATQASVDIPFNYTQKDTLLKGEEITSIFDDGLFTGSNFYDLKYETEFVPIDN